MSQTQITPAAEIYPIAQEAWVNQQIAHINQQNANGQFAVDIHTDGTQPIDELIKRVGTERKVIDNRGQNTGMPGMGGSQSVRFILEAK